MFSVAKLINAYNCDMCSDITLTHNVNITRKINRYYTLQTVYFSDIALYNISFYQTY